MALRNFDLFYDGSDPSSWLGRDKGPPVETKQKPPARKEEKKPVSQRAPIELKVPGLCCEGCEQKIQSTLLKLEGVNSVRVDVFRNKVTIKGKVDPEVALKAARRCFECSEFWAKEKEEGKKDYANKDDKERGLVNLLRDEDATKKSGIMTFQKVLPWDQRSILGEAMHYMKRKDIEELQKQKRSPIAEVMEKELSELLETLRENRKLSRSKMVEEFIAEINNGRDNGYFVSKAWILSLDEHEDEAITSVLQQTGYLEIYQTDTTMFYEKLDEALQVHMCNDLSCTPDNSDFFGGDNSKVVASNDSGAEGKIEQKIYNTGKESDQFHLASQMEKSDCMHPEVSTRSFENEMQSVPVQSNQITGMDSPKSLLDKGKMPLAIANEMLESFQTAIKDTSLDNYSVSTQWLSTLSEQEKEHLNFVLLKAGYLQIHRTSTTTYFERLRGHVQNNPANQSESSSTLQKSSIVGGAESWRAFQGIGGPPADDRQRSNIDDKGSSAVTTAIQESLIREVNCPCHPQHLTVSCTPEPSTSSSQGEYISKYSTRQAVSDSYVTMPKKREGQLMRTGADKSISMRTVSFCDPIDFNEVSLKVSAYTSLTCCLKSDPNDRKVRIEFSTIGGEVKMEDNTVNPKTNTAVLRSVRSNVDACINHSEETDDSEPIILNVQESDNRCPWRRVLQTYELFDDNGQPRRRDDLVWMELSGNHPKNSERGSRTLELQCHVKNRLQCDLDRCCHDAHVLQFAERDPVIFEGDILEDLKSNVRLELNVRYQVVISYNEPRVPKPGQKFVATTRVDKPVDFDCVLEFRTRNFSSSRSRPLEKVFFHGLEGVHVLGPV